MAKPVNDVYHRLNILYVYLIYAFINNVTIVCLFVNLYNIYIKTF